MIDLQGRTALVTGGSRGIGRACCEMLAAAGARVTLGYRVEQHAAEETVRRIAAAGGAAIAVSADVSRVDEAELLLEETVDRFGGVDILVNNAGLWSRSPVDEMTDEEWRTILDVNLTGTFNMIRCCVPGMKRAGRGRIVNISSTAGQRGEAFHAHYASSKGAVIALTKSLAAELCPHGILTNCVAPGWVDTDMSHDALIGPDAQQILSKIPLGRAGTAAEIAGAVLFLASDLATFVNGEILNVNGGAVLCG
ncbi:MAG: 3-oxoacyl-ACP reductase FabG [bacterium]|nr:3-oxoacyl-ACP reductase FabG [bacterium]